MNKYCYATAITNEKYVLGLKALAISLMKVKTKFPLVVFIPNERFNAIMGSILKRDFLSKTSTDDFMIIFKPLPFLDSKKWGIDNKTFTNWNDSFFKLQVFLLQEYEKVILIDSDILVIKNLDHLFEKPIYSAVNSGNAKYNGFNLLNSGLILIKPSMKIHESLIKLIPTAKKHREAAGYNVGDQDVIREYLTTWPEDNWLHLDEGYNLYSDHIKYYIKVNGSKNIHIIHFAGQIKPFDFVGFKQLKYILKSNCFFALKMKIKYHRRYKDSKTKIRYFVN